MMKENFKIQKSKSELIVEGNFVGKVQNVCSKRNEPFIRLAFENYCGNCIQEILKSS